MLESVIDRVGESERSEEEQDERQYIVYFVPVSVGDHGSDRQHGGDQNGRVPAHADPQDGVEQQVEQDRAERQSGQVGDFAFPVAVRHPFADRADEDQHDQQRDRFEQERKDEQRDNHDQRHVDPAVEPFAVKHEQERAVYEGRTGVVLQDYDQHRQSDDHARAQ